jgi:geranylgeranyl pyrophosphate synthase
MDLRGAVTDPAAAAEVCDAIAATGALEEAREQALGYVADAKSIVGELELDAPQQRLLGLVADGVVERYA